GLEHPCGAASKGSAMPGQRVDGAAGQIHGLRVWLTRLDVLVALTLLVTVFMKVTVFYYSTVLGLAQLLRLRSYRPLIVPIGLIVMAISANLYPSDMEQVYAARYIWPFNAALFEIVLPLITLISIGLRSLFKNTGGENE
ncbi:MAG: GerAB/ArcD/ProY family transporter, partial [Oscillospiraceae bacterium]